MRKDPAVPLTLNAAFRSPSVSEFIRAEDGAARRRPRRIGTEAMGGNGEVAMTADLRRIEILLKNKINLGNA